MISDKDLRARYSATFTNPPEEDEENPMTAEETMEPGDPEVCEECGCDDQNCFLCESCGGCDCCCECKEKEE